LLLGGDDSGGGPDPVEWGTGRITKVLNMKPEEIRDMLQEVLGTLMYETEKLTAQKKLAQKDQKVKTIEDVLTNQITPKVEKLREERQRYLSFSAAAQEVQRLARLLVAHEFYTGEQAKLAARDEMAKVAELAAGARTSKKQAQSEEKMFEKQLEVCERAVRREQGLTARPRTFPAAGWARRAPRWSRPPSWRRRRPRRWCGRARCETTRARRARRSAWLCGTCRRARPSWSGF
jgi:hypothetical protein